MKFYSPLTPKNYLVHCSNTRNSEADIAFDVPDDHEVIRNPFIFKWENGQLIKDEVFQKQLIKEKETRLNKPSLEEEITSLKKQNADLSFQLMLNGVL